MSGNGLLVLLLATLPGCYGPEGVYMHTPGAVRAEERPPEVHVPSAAPLAEPSVSDPTPTEDPGAYVSPQGIAMSAAPRQYFETSVEGRELVYWTVGDGPETVLLLGGKHGNERSSSELAFRFVQWVLEDPTVLEGRRLIAAPLVNPDGFARNTRENAHLVDLNRNFPAENWQGANSLRGWTHRPGPYPRSEPETRFLLHLLSSYPADRVISLHGAASCVNWDGPAEELARSMATDCGLPPRASLGYPTPGSFGSYLGIDQRIPTITLELTENRKLARPFEVYRRALLTGLLHPEPGPHRNLSG